eukprot:NODE_458_length_8223_cov_0.302683.p5 type:complete len:158 gc:universal NODE_458_length_8223_cov_0.302683:5288-4815(-)
MDSVDDKGAQLFKLKIDSVTSYVINDPSLLTESVCKYLLEHPEFYELDVFDFPFYSKEAEGILNGIFIKSDLEEYAVKRKIELLQLTFAMNEKMIKNEKIPIESINEELVLEAMHLGLIQGKIGSHLVLQYCRPRGKQDWILQAINGLKQRLISIQK